MQPKLNKKAVSLIVSYVLLISIGLSIAGLVYGWLRFYVDIEDPVKCPDGVHLAIMQAPYYQERRAATGDLEINITLENRGRFNIDGYIIRATNKTDSRLGTIEIYRSLGNKDLVIPGNKTIHKFNSTYLADKIIKRICFIEVQPFIYAEGGDPIACSQISTKKIDCKY